MLAGCAALLLMLGACGGGGGGDDEPSNARPTANAGAPQTVVAGTTVTLNGTASSDPDGAVASYLWSQVAGVPVTLSSSTSAQPTFAAPQVGTATAFRFSLVVTDNEGRNSTAAQVTITVNPFTGPQVAVGGLVRFTRVPFRTTSPIRLDYPNPVLQPARGVVIRALDAGNQAVLASGETSATGEYTLTVPSDRNIVIQLEARLRRTGAAPNWDVRVQNVAGAATAPYTYSSAAFNSNIAVQNIDIPLGIGSNGVATGVRASGPFAILDTIYLGIQTVVGVSPAVNMPALVVDWGAQNAGTFFSPASQRIALMGDLTEDTDEFDRHVIAHEFGHYIEDNFSRSDSLGGSHSLGDRLDPRVAFGEGFASAFAGIVLGDPLMLDSFVINGQPVAGGFNIESNPPASPPQGSSGLACWCSETTVWALAWDLYDGVADGSDNIALGFAPIWDVLVNAQRNTSAQTTIFSFITALKAARPGDVTAINSLVAAQNIDAAVINAFAQFETHAPTDPVSQAPIPNTLPVYAPIFLGTPVVVRSTDDAGRYNKAGNRRLLRFTADTTRSISVTVTTANPNGTTADPDFVVWRAGMVVRAATGPPNAQRNEIATGIQVTAGTDYVLDVYDCANGCSTEQGTPGDYDLTVLIN